MGREVRMVPPDWEHPKQKPSHKNGWKDDILQPMHPWSFDETFAEWLKDFDRIRSGALTDIEKECYPRGLADWLQDEGSPPDPDYYMPQFAEGTATHLMMYEDTSEGTPISPAFATPEELARWLADNNASAFGGMTATYEQWLSTAKRGWAPSAVMTVGDDGKGTLDSGVASAL